MVALPCSHTSFSWEVGPTVWARQGPLRLGSHSSSRESASPLVHRKSQNSARAASGGRAGGGPCGFPACLPASHALLCLSPADVAFITTVAFVWKVSAVTVVSCLPLYILKYLKRKLSPPSYSKLTS